MEIETHLGPFRSRLTRQTRAFLPMSATHNGSDRPQAATMSYVSISGYTDRGIRRLTVRRRSLPDFIVIGGMRCGTSAFFDWISAHPDVRPSSTKEIHFFDHNYHRGERWLGT